MAIVIYYIFTIQVGVKETWRCRRNKSPKQRVSPFELVSHDMGKQDLHNCFQAYFDFIN